jgi:hypothetical protein
MKPIKSGRLVYQGVIGSDGHKKNPAGFLSGRAYFFS